MTAEPGPGRYVDEMPRRYVFEVWDEVGVHIRGHLFADVACQHADQIGGYVTRIELLYDARPYPHPPNRLERLAE